MSKLRASMLERVSVPARRISAYDEIADASLLERLRGAAARLDGRRVLHLNSTAVGGGVAELLRAEMGLLTDLGLNARWMVLKAEPTFFEITKRIHNGLQGDPENLKAREWAYYEEVNREVAAEIDASAWDLIVIHDPQPAAVRRFVSNAASARWVWRCHIDVSHPNPVYVKRMVRYVEGYDATVFSHPTYVPNALRSRAVVIHPGIDPLNAKNRSIPKRDARRVLDKFGIDSRRPLVTQISRFDPWKDPLGAIEAWQLARRHVPDLQLALVGSTANDDPESPRVLEQVERAAEGLPDVHVIANTADDETVNAFQTASTVVLQKSLREGFGLTVSEALWSGTPVVGAAVGGIPLQIDDGRTGFLVTTPKEAARRIVELVRDPTRAAQMGAAGQNHVRERFLLPRMIAEDLDLWASTLIDGGRKLPR